MFINSIEFYSVMPAIGFILRARAAARLLQAPRNIAPCAQMALSLEPHPPNRPRRGKAAAFYKQHSVSFSTGHDDKEKTPVEAEAKDDNGLIKKLMAYPAKKEREKVIKRKQLEKEIGQLGRGSEVKEYMQSSGKLFMADEELIPAGSAPVFPKIEGTTLAETQLNINKMATSNDAFATLVGVSFNDHATSTVEGWCDAYRDHFGIDASVFVCCCSNHWLLEWFDGMVRSTLRKRVPESQHSSYISLIGSKDVQNVQDSLSIKNTLPSYVFLVDRNGLVRWRGTGSSTDPEIASLLDAAEELRLMRPDESLPRWQQVGSGHR